MRLRRSTSPTSTAGSVVIVLWTLCWSSSATFGRVVELPSLLGALSPNGTSEPPLVLTGPSSLLRPFQYDHIPSLDQDSGPLLGHYLSSNFFVSSSASSECANHTRLFLEEVAQTRPWALQMLDASAKLPSGILQGNFDWWGSYSECVRTVRKSDSGTGPGPRALFSGQYCSVKVTLNVSGSELDNAIGKRLQDFLKDFELTMPGMDELAVRIGLCIPSTCSTSDVDANFQKILNLLNVGAIAKTETCHTDDPQPLDSATIAVIAVWGVFGVFIVLGTLYEITTLLERKCWCVRQMAFKEMLAESPSMDPLAYSASEQNLSKKSRFSEFLLSFSLVTNGRQILNVSEANGSLSVLHSIRFLSMTWIILGHTYYVGLLAAPIWDNLKDFAIVTKEFAFQGIVRGILGVDTFLFLSGLLVVYVSLKKMKASDGKLNIPMFYIHRLIRLSPVYMMAIAWVSGPSDLVASGPLWSSMTPYKVDCHQTWWKSLLFINNFGDTTHMCVPHSWYISLDTQLYLITPLLLYPLYRYPRLGVSLTVLCILASCITAGAISYTMGLPSSAVLMSVPQDKLIAYSIDYYIKPYCRLGPYGVGMLTGYSLLKDDFKNKIKSPVAYLFWCLAIACNLAVLYGTYGQFLTLQEPPVLLSAIFNAVSGTIWAMGIGWLTYACISGYGGFINKILSWKAWIPLSRLTYCAYLLHMIVLQTFFFSRENKLHFDHVIMVVFYLGLLIITYGCSFLFSLIFEAPFIRLEKAIRDSRSRDMNLNEVPQR